MIRVFLVALILSPAFLWAQDAVKRDEHQMHGLHNDPKAYIGSLEDPKRDAYQKPHEVLTALNLKSGEVIADIGAGSGYFTFRLSHFVGDKGKVYAVDVSPDMILPYQPAHPRIESNERRLHPRRSGRSIAAGSIGQPVFLLRLWHHVENQTKYLALMKKMLKPGGEIVMIDFHKKESPIGPPLQMKIAREDLIKQMEANGFRLAKEHTFLPYQYFLVFAPK